MRWLTRYCLRRDEIGPVCAVEVRGAFSGEFKMLPLVIADWDMSGPVNQYIGGLENRIREEAQLQLICSHGVVVSIGLVVHLKLTLASY